MNPFLLPPKKRLADWKDLRQSLSDYSEEEQLSRVAEYWAQAPTCAGLAYNIDEPQSIPGPWEMVSAGDWCEYSLAIGMEFTLRLAGWDADRLQLAMIKDFDESLMKLVLIIDDSIVLNYSWGTVQDYPTTRHDVVGRWSFSKKHYAPAA